MLVAELTRRGALAAAGEELHAFSYGSPAEGRPALGAILTACVAAGEEARLGREWLPEPVLWRHGYVAEGAPEGQMRRARTSRETLHRMPGRR